MSFTVFLGNLPAWVTADDIKGWLSAENLVADAIKVIRNPETQESKGFAFIDAPNAEEMNSIIRRFDRAPLEDRLLRANPAQPPKPKGPTGGSSRPTHPQSGHPGPGGTGAPSSHVSSGHTAPVATGHVAPQHHAPTGGGGHTGSAFSAAGDRPPRRAKKAGSPRREHSDGPQSAFAEELARAL
jgi:RNA recognition motif-containing protein